MRDDGGVKFALFVRLDVAHLTAVGALALSAADRFASSGGGRAGLAAFTAVTVFVAALLLLAGLPAFAVTLQACEFFLEPELFVSKDLLQDSEGIHHVVPLSIPLVRVVVTCWL